MRKLEKKVELCVSALISGLNIPKEEIGLDNTTYLHPCFRDYKDMKKAKENLSQIARGLPCEGKFGINFFKYHIIIKKESPD